MAMATNAVKAPIFKAVTRNYVTQMQPVCGLIKKVRTCVLPNKLVVACSDNGAAITRLSIVFRAGSRYETPDTQGCAHILRIAAGLSTKHTSNFAIVRNLQQVGATLTCTTSRETIAYTLEGSYDAIERSSEYLSDIVCDQVFKPWELSDAMPRLSLELASLSPQVRAINFLHRAAYRTDLGNSLFCAKHNVGKVSSETLQHYVAKNFTTNRAAVVGIGISEDNLSKYAQNMSLESGTAQDTTSKYYGGGEIRSEKGGEYAHVALAAEGSSLCNHKDSLALGVLQYIFGVGSYVKRGHQCNSLLARAIKPSDTLSMSAINVSYSDTGLFGVLISGPAKEVGPAVVAAARTIKSACIAVPDVVRAKNQLKAATLLAAESGTKYIDVMGTHALIAGNVSTPEQIACEIDNISTADLQRVAEKIGESCMSIASVGNLSSVPYLDELN